jgi:cell division septal protein FtsQ
LYKKQGLQEEALLPSNANDKNLIALLCRQEFCFWLNEKGVAYHQSKPFLGNLFLLIEDKTSRSLVLGQKLIEPAILAELNFLKKNTLSETGVNLKTGETQDAKINDFDFITEQGWRVRFSVSENAHKTLAVLKQTLAQIEPQDFLRLEYIDLRVPNKVYYKLR